MELEYAATHVSPKDFSLFVDNLPRTPVARSGVVKEHFSRWGSVYSFTPALDDEWVRFWQVQKNDALRRLRVFMELDEYARKTLERAENLKRGEVSEEFHKNNPVEGVLLPPLHLSAAIAGVDYATEVSFAFLVLCSLPVLKQGTLSFRSNLHAYLRGLNHVINEILLHNENVRSFNRGVVTFESMKDSQSCLDEYHHFGWKAAMNESTVTSCLLRAIHKSEAGQGVDDSHVGQSRQSLSAQDHQQKNPLYGGQQPFNDEAQSSPAHHKNFPRGHAGENLNGVAGEAGRFLYQDKYAITLSRSVEPLALIWDSLDTSLFWRRIRSCISAALVIASIFILGYSLSYLPTQANGALTTFSAFLVVILTQVSFIFWRVVTYYVEQPMSEGIRAQSMFLKTLCTQISIMISANVGAYGLPMDPNNGYLTDFYSGAGAFMVQVAIIETFLPPALYFSQIDVRLYRFLWGESGSVSLSRWVWEPPPFWLEERCASVMRVVLMCCIFSPAVPILIPSTALLFLVQWLTDRHTLYHMYRVSISNAALIRGMEKVILLGALFNAFMAVFIIRYTDTGNVSAPIVNIVVFFTLIAVIVWAFSGLMSFKLTRKKDCCCGVGLFIVKTVFRCPPWLARLIFLPHEAFLRLMFGPKVFGQLDRNDLELVKSRINRLTAESTTYSALSTSEKFSYMGFHPHPYSVWERAQLGLWGTPGIVPLPLRPYVAREFEEAPVRRLVGRAYDSDFSWNNTAVTSHFFDPRPLIHQYRHKLGRQIEAGSPSHRTQQVERRTKKTKAPSSSPRGQADKSEEEKALGAICVIGGIPSSI